MQNNKLVIDESSESTEMTDEPSDKVTPVHLLGFAKWILAVIAGMYVLSALAEFLSPNNHIYEACKVTLPSIATLVIGYYFGSTK